MNYYRIEQEETKDSVSQTTIDEIIEHPSSQSLQRLVLHGQKVSLEALNKAFCDDTSFPCLKELDLSGVKLDVVPACFARLAGLQILDLCDNIITSFDTTYDELLPDRCWQRMKLFANRF